MLFSKIDSFVIYFLLEIQTANHHKTRRKGSLRAPDSSSETSNASAVRTKFETFSINIT